MKEIGSYKNGNYLVTIYDDGTKVRQNNEDSLIPATVESMDIKLTNYCNMNCKFCHEKSSIEGEHGDILSPSFIDKLHPYTELALGGGNVLTHPQLMQFLNKCKTLKLIPSMTVHQKHFGESFHTLRFLTEAKLIYGLGISMTEATDEFIQAVKTFPNAVVHVINGVVTKEQLEKLARNDIKILILGYKNFGRGVDYFTTQNKQVIENQNWLKDNLKKIIDEKWFKVISFDNLAIKQLEPKSLMSNTEWDKFYMGDDGQYTMYIDMVKREFATSSTSTERYPLLDTIEDMFKVIRKPIENKTEEDLDADHRKRRGGIWPDEDIPWVNEKEPDKTDSGKKKEPTTKSKKSTTKKKTTTKKSTTKSKTEKE